MEDHIHPNSEKFTSGTHVPYWIDSVSPISYQKLALNKEVDVVIVGGGISGVSIAYCLSMEGKKVALVEDGFIGSGETGRTTAHLVTALDNRYYSLEQVYGEDQAKLIANSHSAAIDFIEKTCTEEKIECDFERVNGYLFLHHTDKPENLGKEFESALKAGLDVEQTNILLGNKKNVKALKFNNQGQFHPLKYIKGLCDCIIKNGGDIYTNTHAKEINSSGVTTNEGFKIEAKYVVIATNSPVNNKYAIHLRQYPYRTYVIGAKIKKGSLPTSLWWDTGDFSVNGEFPPYHYVRTQSYSKTHDLLIIGGEDHPTGLSDIENIPEESRYNFLESWARENFSGIEEIIYKWSGQVLEPADALAFIGHNPMDAKNVFIVTGDSGNGMTHATIAGMLIRDLILEKENRWQKIYSPSRFKFKAGKAVFKELVGGLVNYLKTKPRYEDETGLKNIQRNEGKIVEFEGKKFGAYRDGDDNLHFIDAECTHMGCIVKWNNDEKSWDCPCHGSRFTYEGEILNGPANQALTYYSQHKNSVHNI
jgi:glycine/D-amino acid oxidase-like deaminating enzyme/nitrite reductase/ring-hydroxylating ferredoxin subunit